MLWYLYYWFILLPQARLVRKQRSKVHLAVFNPNISQNQWMVDRISKGFSFYGILDQHWGIEEKFTHDQSQVGWINQFMHSVASDSSNHINFSTNWLRLQEFIQQEISLTHCSSLQVYNFWTPKWHLHPNLDIWTILSHESVIEQRSLSNLSHQPQSTPASSSLPENVANLGDMLSHLLHSFVWFLNLSHYLSMISSFVACSVISVMVCISLICFCKNYEHAYFSKQNKNIWVRYILPAYYSELLLWSMFRYARDCLPNYSTFETFWYWTEFGILLSAFWVPVLHFERLYSSKIGTYISLATVCIFMLHWLIYSIFYNLASTFIFTSPVKYLWLMNVHVYVAVGNFVTKRATHHYEKPTTVAYDFIFWIFQCLIIGKYNNSWLFTSSIFVLTMTVDFLSLLFVMIQVSKGARFFLPDQMRGRVYQVWTKMHNPTNHEELKLENSADASEINECNIWMNKLCDAELIYCSSLTEFTNIDTRIGAYIIAPCSHKFHPKWLFSRVESWNNKCPIWECDFPFLKFEDNC